MLPRQLGECPPFGDNTAFPLSKSILLCIGGIPNPVDEKVRDIEEAQNNWIPVVF